MKTKRIKAIKVECCHDYWLATKQDSGHGYILPADAESYEQMVEQMARAIHGNGWTFDVGEDRSRECYYDMARAALGAIGITNPAKKGRK